MKLNGERHFTRQRCFNGMNKQRRRQAGHVYAVDRALIDVPGGDGLAGAVVVRVLPDLARTQDVASADFEQSSFELV